MADFRAEVKMKIKIGPYPKTNWLKQICGIKENQFIEVKIDKWDTWSMDHTLAYIIHPMLVQLKDTQHGYPSKLTEQEWNDILDEMIWAFEQKCKDDWTDQYYGKWVTDKDKDKDKILSGHFDSIDHDGLKEHQERITQGLKLFGKYYESLWD